GRAIRRAGTHRDLGGYGAAPTGRRVSGGLCRDQVACSDVAWGLRSASRPNDPGKPGALSPPAGVLRVGALWAQPLARKGHSRRVLRRHSELAGAASDESWRKPNNPNNPSRLPTAGVGTESASLYRLWIVHERRFRFRLGHHLAPLAKIPFRYAC